MSDIMGLKAGIVGLPNVGKSTLFNAITKQKILAANYPFATIEPNVGIVVVPDKRLDFLVKMYNPKSIVPATYEFFDIAGLVKGASTGEGLGNKFLSHIRETDAIVEVVRCFRNSDIIHVENTVNPVRDIETINVELMLADLEVVDDRLSKIAKKAEQTKDKDLLKELVVLKKVKESLDNSIPVRRVQFTEDEEKILRPFCLLTQKPIIYMANIAEDMIGKDDENDLVQAVVSYANKEHAKVITVSARAEEELADLSDEDRVEFLNELGLESSGLDKLIKATYDLLGLATFLTAGADECRAWTFKKGMKAPECAGIIHSDFEKGFIRAEVMSYSDLEKLGSEKTVQESGKLRIEGKDYFMQDGDICHFRFNV